MSPRLPLRRAACATLALLALAGCRATPSAAAPRPPRSILLQLDQDLLGPSNEDRDYTQGLLLEYHEQAPPGAAAPDTPGVGAVQRWLDEHVLPAPEDGPDAHHGRGFGFGQLSFTPDDLANPAPVLDDRPYASILFVSHKRTTASPEGARGSDLRFGILGTRAAESVQTWIHRVFRTLTGSSEPVDPKGWPNQISDAGEPTLLYRVSSDRVLAARHGAWDLALLTDLNLGYQTNGGLGLGLRAGRIGSPIAALPFDPAGRASHVPALAPGDHWWWAAARLKLVAYDALLQGQFRGSVYEVDADDVTRVVLQAATGVSLSLSESWQASYSVNARTKELREPGRTHYWGGVTLAARF